MEEATSIWDNIRTGLEFKLIDIGGHSISMYNVVVVLCLFIVLKILVKSFEKIVRHKISENSLTDNGKAHAIVQIGKYIIYVIGFVLAIEAFGFNTTTLIISSSALFVGLGFGLQEAFRDLISGIILLFEGDVLIGDVIEMDNGIVGVVKKINLRTSMLRTRDGITMIVPNSQLINDRVINWSNSNKLTRFNVKVGVAYGSDVELVKKLLLESAEELDTVSEQIKPFVRFIDFGESSLDFEIYFWTEEVWRIENSKSELRFSIDRKFRENNISIPFPQRDLHFKSKDFPIND
ncbi:MAG: mechanosensitive ion channel protein MscS [Bacteroidetes bacterium]|nr:MAG: mechanosensitive ion channel protein MscS [Bacteroidota bacterium]MBL1143354.1 mechanosensitive ion channel protein MscS [Bacteroidota bacterium]MCB0801561.1 mechanosensitive ion channel [Flavobacteriales bacterium]NOG56156.1 mechanosensitive ion channel [Bacteroidota bacterium]